MKTTIAISNELRYTLLQMKLDKRYKTVEQLVQYLVDNEKKKK